MDIVVRVGEWALANREDIGIPGLLSRRVIAASVAVLDIDVRDTEISPRRRLVELDRLVVVSDHDADFLSGPSLDQVIMRSSQARPKSSQLAVS